MPGEMPTDSPLEELRDQIADTTAALDKKEPAGKEEAPKE
jgi:hypothetical protein